jgi:hypothetical protein
MKLLTRIFFSIVFFVCSLWLLFPIRELINSLFFSHIESYLISDKLIVESLGSRSINLSSGNIDFGIRAPFGNFFLIGIIGLILSGAKKDFFLYEIYNQIFCLIIICISLFLSSLISPNLLTLADFISVYINPLISIGIITIYLTNYRNREI